MQPWCGGSWQQDHHGRFLQTAWPLWTPATTTATPCNLLQAVSSQVTNLRKLDLCVLLTWAGQFPLTLRGGAAPGPLGRGKQGATGR